MNKKHFYKLLLIVCFLSDIGSVFCAYTDPKEQFSVLWKDTSRKEVALNCLQQCMSDEKHLLNITKHLIGHRHVLDISETQKKLSANFLLFQV